MSTSKPSCPHTPDCALFARFSTTGFLRVWQINFCEGEFTSCERFKRSSMGLTVPAKMLPNGTMLGERARPAPESAPSADDPTPKP